jgi:hypothetical protein
VRCANLPISIRNGEGFGGGRVVGWLPIVKCYVLSVLLIIDHYHNLAG